MKHIFSLFIIFLCLVPAYSQVNNRIRLTQLERAPEIDSSRIGMIGLSDINGNQRYAYYVNVNDTCMSTAPTPTGNSIVSIFWQLCSTDSIWYVDWEGRSILLSPYGSGASDADWLVIDTENVPFDINDSIFTYQYAAIGARYVWPTAEFLVNDSLGESLAVIQGDRNAALGFYDGFNGTFSEINHGGVQPVWYFGPDQVFSITQASGTPGAVVGPFVNHMQIRMNDSTVYFNQYPNTRDDGETVVNILSTDVFGKLLSTPLDTVLAGAGGIYGGSGEVPTNTVANLVTPFTFISDSTGGNENYIRDRYFVGFNDRRVQFEDGIYATLELTGTEDDQVASITGSSDSGTSGTGRVIASSTLVRLRYDDNSSSVQSELDLDATGAVYQTSIPLGQQGLQIVSFDSIYLHAKDFSETYSLINRISIDTTEIKINVGPTDTVNISGGIAQYISPPANFSGDQIPTADWVTSQGGNGIYGGSDRWPNQTVATGQRELLFTTDTIETVEGLDYLSQFGFQFFTDVSYLGGNPQWLWGQRITETTNPNYFHTGWLADTTGEFGQIWISAFETPSFESRMRLDANNGSQFSATDGSYSNGLTMGGASNKNVTLLMQEGVSNFTYLVANADSLSIQKNDLGGNNSIQWDANGIDITTESGDRVIIDGADTRYTTNYASLYSARSLVDKNYVDSVAAAGGGGTPGGGLFDVQFNSGGSFAGDEGLQYPNSGELKVGDSVEGYDGSIDFEDNSNANASLNATPGSFQMLMPAGVNLDISYDSGNPATITGNYIQYANNYAANYVDRSLTDKNYVDSLVAASGGGSPGGNTNNVQVNDGIGGFAGDDAFQYDQFGTVQIGDNLGFTSGILQFEDGFGNTHEISTLGGQFNMDINNVNGQITFDNTNTFTITGDAMRYNNNYASNYVPRSIPDVNYVDSLFSTAGASPGGSNTEIQFNNSGSFGADDALRWSGSVLQIGNTGTNAEVNFLDNSASVVGEIETNGTDFIISSENSLNLKLEVDANPQVVFNDKQSAGFFQAVGEFRGEVRQAATILTNPGDAIHSTVVISRETDNTGGELFLDGSTERCTIPSDALWYAKVEAIAFCSNGDGTVSTGDAYAINYPLVAIKNIGGTTSLLPVLSGGAPDVYSDASMTGATLVPAADNTNDALTVTFTPPGGAGAAATFITVATIQITQTLY